MALDHYVSQTHLRNFNSPSLDGMMYAIRKSNLKQFPTKSRDVCRIENNSTNTYLREDRAIEAFLKTVEPKYNASLTKIRERKINEECIRCVAGFAAFVLTCSPAGMRLHSRPLENLVHTTAVALDAEGKLPRSPESLGEKSLREFLQDGTIKVDVDPKYPQALGIALIERFVSFFGNSPWDILVNQHAQNNPFFTSDFPVAIEFLDLSTPINRIVPLAPDLAVRIRPNARLRGTNPDPFFSNFSPTYRYLKRNELISINRSIVRCAEELVFFRDQAAWIEKFVSKHRHHHVESMTVGNVDTYRILSVMP